jgi:hypothetical protein
MLYAGEESVFGRKALCGFRKSSWGETPKIRIWVNELLKNVGSTPRINTQHCSNSIKMVWQGRKTSRWRTRPGGHRRGAGCIPNLHKVAATPQRWQTPLKPPTFIATKLASALEPPDLHRCGQIRHLDLEGVDSQARRMWQPTLNTRHPRHRPIRQG